MDLFERYNPRNRIYLTSIDDHGESSPGSTIRMLLCDARGRLTVEDIKTATYEAILSLIELLSDKGSSCASLCLDGGRGGRKSCVLEIREKEAKSLDSLLHTINETAEFVPQLEAIIRLGRNKTRGLKWRKGQGEGIYIIDTGD